MPTNIHTSNRKNINKRKNQLTLLDIVIINRRIRASVGQTVKSKLHSIRWRKICLHFKTKSVFIDNFSLIEFALAVDSNTAIQ